MSKDKFIGPNGRNVSDLILLAKSGLKAYNPFHDAKNEDTIIAQWVKEMSIAVGHEKAKAIDLYQEFKAWCEYNRFEEIPTVTAWGRAVKSWIVKKKLNSGGVYLINQTTAELRKRRDKKEREETKKQIDKYKSEEET